MHLQLVWSSIIRDHMHVHVLELCTCSLSTQATLLSVKSWLTCSLACDLLLIVLSCLRDCRNINVLPAKTNPQLCQAARRNQGRTGTPLQLNPRMVTRYRIATFHGLIMLHRVVTLYGVKILLDPDPLPQTT